MKITGSIMWFSLELLGHVSSEKGDTRFAQGKGLSAGKTGRIKARELKVVGTVLKWRLQSFGILMAIKVGILQVLTMVREGVLERDRSDVLRTWEVKLARTQKVIPPSHPFR